MHTIGLDLEAFAEHVLGTVFIFHFLTEFFWTVFCWN